METVMVIFYVIAAMVTSSRHCSAFSIDREDMTTHNLQSTTNSYSDWSVGLSSEDDADELSATEFTCQEPSEADLINQLYSKVLAGDDLRTDSIPEEQMVPKWEEITGMGVYVKSGPYQRLVTSTLLRRNINRRSLCPWTKTQHNDSSRYPRTIYHARCLCTDCTDGSQGNQMSTISTCVPVTKQINVLRRGECVNGTFSYDFAREPVTVGCVCSRSSDQGSRSINDTAR